MKRHNYNFIKKNMIVKKCIWRKYEKEKTDNSSSNQLMCNIIHMANK